MLDEIIDVPWMTSALWTENKDCNCQGGETYLILIVLFKFMFTAACGNMMIVLTMFPKCLLRVSWASDT